MAGWLLRNWTILLLVGIPIAAALEFFAPEARTAIFVAAMTAILPLAAYIGRATERLASRLGGGIGGLMPRSGTPRRPNHLAVG